MVNGFQKMINRMSRATLDVLPSTLAAFLDSEGGIMPARACLDHRQEGFTARLCASPRPDNRQILAGATEQAIRLRRAVGPPGRDVALVELTGTASGLTFLLYREGFVRVTSHDHRSRPTKKMLSGRKTR